MSWDAVTFTGGDTYIAYRIEYAEASQNPGATANYDWQVAVDDYQPTTLVVTNLTCGTTVVFRATAKNTEGYGQSCNPTVPKYLAGM